ncbi:PAS domain S-box-containing protein [Halorubrum alkaliphilum]|uniref:histidine kinase n=1 Tax=Halorubrum alkaliphilum TaxID=261290 RepID=A0A8T4GGI0_9EURY|nr:PAS domain-containing sensor histidine kinase [Halorubrum alkaliphilum]MBP1922165.1 PAS domain S-box-containing protein [Halorubrum alkaliphilum]
MTERSRRERELRRYETILDSLEDAVYAIDPDGRIAYVNERYAEMKGVDRETLVGTDIYDWVTDETAAKATRAREALANDDRDVGTVEYDFLTADGETFPVEMRFAQVSANGDTLDRVGVIRDVTERQQREDALRRKNERLDEFASIVSHDLRNPLNVAEGRLDLLQDDLADADVPPALSEHVAEIEHAHERMRVLIEDLLTLARTGDVVEETESVDIGALAEDAWRNVATAEASLRVATDRSVRADRGRLERLLENLFRNAIEHAGEDVAVTVGWLPNREGFFVGDDGPGIPADEREAVFESGYSTTTDGTGFGLRIVERIADGHGWAVNVTDGDRDSNATGARFEFTGVETCDS